MLIDFLSFQFSPVYYVMFILFICSLSDDDYDGILLVDEIDGLIHFLMWMFYWVDPWPGLTLGSLRPLGWVTS